ncbi:hypothetical protein [Mogibacterium pumilum]|nr:hypothetical protein [Mogibacterium pumilum]
MQLRNNEFYRIVCCILILITLMSFLCGCGDVKKDKSARDDAKKHKMIYGLTIDDAWYDDTNLNDVLQGLKNLKHKPTVRIVMSIETNPSEYVKLFKSIKPYADIMACPVDSFEMNKYEDREGYLQRFKTSYTYLSKYVNVWEVGNEVNGIEWIKQKPELIVDKVSAANEFIKRKGSKTALTLYCTDSPQRDMIDWTEKNIPTELSDSVNYCFVSYYEDDNKGYEPKWKSIFKKLGKIFPSASLGIGECGNTAESATEKSKIKMVKKYYGMPKLHERFVGGYFWWNWVEDCIPCKNNKIYETIDEYGFD